MRISAFQGFDIRLPLCSVDEQGGFVGTGKMVTTGCVVHPFFPSIFPTSLPSIVVCILIFHYACVVQPHVFRVWYVLQNVCCSNVFCLVVIDWLLLGRLQLVAALGDTEEQTLYARRVI